MNRVVLALLLAVSGCTGGETVSLEKEPSRVAAAPAPIRTDRSSYRLHDGPRGPEATIIATLRAPSDQTLYIANCNGASSLALQRRVQEEWVYAWVVPMNACLSPPIVVAPGGEHTATIHLRENAGGVPGPENDSMIESGTYRVAWTGVFTSFDPNPPGFGPELPLEQRVSAPVTIAVPGKP